MGETGPQCATGVLHPLLHVPTAPCRCVTTETQTAWISKGDTGKGRIPMQDRQAHHCYTQSHTSKETGCSISTERFFQTEDFQGKPGGDLAPTQTTLVCEPCSLANQHERRNFLPVQPEMLYSRENHFYLCSTYCNSHQSSQALKALMDQAAKGKSSWDVQSSCALTE